jgi:hypothetical protein
LVSDLALRVAEVSDPDVQGDVSYDLARD